MKKKTIKKRILAGLLAFSLIVQANVAGAKTQTVLETNVTEASEGCTLVGVYGSYFAQAKEALAKINEIRKKHVKQEIYEIREIPADIFSHRIMFP